MHDVQCGDTNEKWTATRILNTSNSDYDPSSYHHTYNAIISYDCGLGKRFKDGNNSIQHLDYICDKNPSAAEVKFHLLYYYIDCDKIREYFRDTGAIIRLSQQ